MRRRVIIALAALGAIMVVLALALASVGTELDQARIDRDEYQFQVEDLQEELDTIAQEREKLQQQVDEQLKTIEQWKVQQGHAQGGQATPATPPPAAEPAQPPAQ